MILYLIINIEFSLKFNNPIIRSSSLWQVFIWIYFSRPCKYLKNEGFNGKVILQLSLPSEY